MAANLSEQIDRIKNNLMQAKALDPDMKVFGADEHQYAFDAPATMSEVRAFEREFGVTLPEEYVAFITAVGNGGTGSYGGAGPYYGIYPLGDFGYMQITADSMSAPCMITSSLTPSQWERMTAFARNSSRNEGGVLYDLKYDALFSGLMTIGTRGCSGQTMLVLNGEDYGRVVYVDQDLYMPVFPEQKNFLEWYENWLDACLSKSAASL